MEWKKTDYADSSCVVSRYAVTPITNNPFYRPMIYCRYAVCQVYGLKKKISLRQFLNFGVEKKLVRGWSKSGGGGRGGPEENGGWVSKFRALAKGGSPQFSASGGVGHESF